MSYDDDEIAETGDMHEINGREYSVVGNTVYKKSLFGEWKPVEDEDEIAEAGDIRRRNHETYSIVGDTVYRKNWLGGWDELEDDEERAEAGDHFRRNGEEYSQVGDSIFKKNPFRNWRLVEDNDEEAEAGNIRERNSYTYSIVGNTVYRKKWLSGWDEVDDDDERAEAGDQYEDGGYEYSRVGDIVYKKGIFGGWDKLKGSNDFEDDESSNDYNHQQDSDDSDSRTYESSSSSTSSSSSNGTWGLVIVIIIAVAIIYLAKNKSNNSITPPVAQTNTSSVPENVSPAMQETNQYGTGNGHVSFYSNCTYCFDVEIFYENTSVGVIPSEPLQIVPDCSDAATLQVNIPAGSRTFIMKEADGQTWEQTVEVIEGRCVLQEIIKPDIQYTEPDSITPVFEDTKTNDPDIENTVKQQEFQILSPHEHDNFDYPRYVNVQWNINRGAESYEVELQLANEPYDYSSTSYSPMPYDNGGIYTTSSVSVTVQGMGKQVHRLRVKAISSGGVLAVTEWIYINFND